MNKRITSVILTIIFVGGALCNVLIWLGITPAYINNNKFISGIVNLLNFKIPVYLVALIALIAIFLYKKIANIGLKKPLSAEKKVKEIKQEKTEEVNEDKIVKSLSKEQKILLLSLLEQSNQQRYRYMVQDDYKEEFRKTTADFNIAEAQLKDLNLIYFRSTTRGTLWILTKEGLKVASIIHSQKKV